MLEKYLMRYISALFAQRHIPTLTQLYVPTPQQYYAIP
jgi:hypothetical protein